MIGVLGRAVGRRPRTALVLAVLACATLVYGLQAAVSTTGGAVIVVDRNHRAASDDAEGTAREPLATIQEGLRRAMARNRDGQPTTVRVHPGVYREALALPRSERRTDAPLVLEGVGADRVVVSGSDVWTGWQQQDDGTWALPWPHRWGLAPIPEGGWAGYLERNDVTDLIRRREVVWSDGRVLRQVLDPAELVDGSFHVDEAAGRITLRMAAGSTPDDATVEVAVRDRLLTVDRWQHVTVRGITFRHAATALQSSAVRFEESSHLLIEDARFEWSNWSGLGFRHATDVTVRRTAATDNGVVGIGSYRGRRMAFTDVESSRNNTWRGPWSNHFGWEVGSKFFRLEDATFTRWHAADNEANGLWFDTDVANVTIRDSFFGRNLRRGLFLEAVQGPIRLEGSTVCENLDRGVVDGRADDVTLVDNRLFANRGAQLLFSGARAGRTFTRSATGQPITVRSQRWTVVGNLLEAAGEDRLIATTLGEEAWAVVRGSLDARDNTYRHPGATPFALPGGPVGVEGWASEAGETDVDHAPATTSPACEAPLPPVPASPPAAEGPE